MQQIPLLDFSCLAPPSTDAQPVTGRHWSPKGGSAHAGSINLRDNQLTSPPHPPSLTSIALLLTLQPRRLLSNLGGFIGAGLIVTLGNNINSMQRFDLNLQAANEMIQINRKWKLYSRPASRLRRLCPLTI